MWRKAIKILQGFINVIGNVQSSTAELFRRTELYYAGILVSF